MARTDGPIDALLAAVWDSVSGIDEGAVADYIPELAKADPALFGMSLATLDGAVYTAGELVPFTIQSISKPFVYALALEDRGRDAVLAKVGVEPTGDAFNSISLDDVSAGRSTRWSTRAPSSPPAWWPGRTRAEQLDRDPRRPVAVRRARPGRRRGRLRLRARHRRPQPRDRLPDAHFGMLDEDVEARSTSTSASARSW